MGSNTSKSTNPNLDTAVQTQKPDTAEAADSSDPRSPTPEIIRTPLQNKTGQKHNITKNADLRKTFDDTQSDTHLIHNNPILSAVIKNHLQSYDPRSPTQEFERTPIILSTIDIKKKVNAECDELEDVYESCSEIAQEAPEILAPKNLCNGFCDLSLNETILEEPLGSSTAPDEAIKSNISLQCNTKPTMLLVTDFDYIHANNDMYDENYLSAETEDDTKKNSLFKVLDNDPRSPSTGIERTPIVVANDNKNNHDNVEEMSDDTLINVLQNTNANLRQTVLKKLKSECLLIYEDSSGLNETPKKSTTITGSRTPLSCMKNKSDAGHMRTKSITSQKVAKKVSHIPRLKSLHKQPHQNPIGSTSSLSNISKNTMVVGDCENTPPNSHRDRWDLDNSVVL